MEDSFGHQSKSRADVVAARDTSAHKDHRPRACASNLTISMPASKCTDNLERFVVVDIGSTQPCCLRNSSRILCTEATVDEASAVKTVISACSHDSRHPVRPPVKTFRDKWGTSCISSPFSNCTAVMRAVLRSCGWFRVTSDLRLFRKLRAPMSGSLHGAVEESIQLREILTKSV